MAFENLVAALTTKFADMSMSEFRDNRRIVVKPTNNQLLAPARDPASAETRRLLEQWGKLHAVRSGLSLAATLLYLDLLVRA